MFSTKSRKSELHCWILRIRITLITKFQLKPTILIFGAKFAQKGYFRSKTEKVNSTIEFYLFKVVQSFSLNWPIEILMSWQFWVFIRKFVLLVAETRYFTFFSTQFLFEFPKSSLERKRKPFISESSSFWVIN